MQLYISSGVPFTLQNSFSLQAIPPSLTEIFSHSFRVLEVQVIEQALSSREVARRMGRSLFMVRIKLGD